MKEPGVDALAGRGYRAIVDRADEFDLAVRQALGRRFGLAALQNAGIDATLPGVVDDLVLDPVDGITSVEHGILQQVKLLARKRLVFGNEPGDLLGRPQTGHDHASRREDRGAHNDAVEISGIALHGHQPLAPAGGTTAKIGVIGCPRVVPLGKLLADNRGQMDRTMPEVFDGDMVRHNCAVCQFLHHPIFG